MDNISSKKNCNIRSTSKNPLFTATEEKILPNEVLFKIFEYLEKDQLMCSVSRVCTRWWMAVKCLPCWKLVKVSNKDSLSKAIMSLKWQSDNLESVATLNRQDNALLLEVINPSKIKCLSMSTSEDASNDSAVVVERISKGELLFPYLRELKISIRRRKVLDVVCNLQRLSLNKLHVQADSTVLLGDFSDFCFLDLKELKFYQEVYPKKQDIEKENKRLQFGLRALRDNCKHLHMSLAQINDSTIEVISELYQLESLYIWIGPPVTSKCLDFLARAKFENLTSLEIEDNRSCCSEGDLINFFKVALFRNGLKRFAYFNKENISADTNSAIAKLCPTTKLIFNQFNPF